MFCHLIRGNAYSVIHIALQLEWKAGNVISTLTKYS